MDKEQSHEMKGAKHPWLITAGSFLFLFLIAYLTSLIVPIGF